MRKSETPPGGRVSSHLLAEVAAHCPAVSAGGSACVLSIPADTCRNARCRWPSSGRALAGLSDDTVEGKWRRIVVKFWHASCTG